MRFVDAAYPPLLRTAILSKPETRTPPLSPEPRRLAAAHMGSFDEGKRGERRGRRPAEARKKGGREDGTEAGRSRHEEGREYGFVGTQKNLGAGGKEDTILTGAN